MNTKKGGKGICRIEAKQKIKCIRKCPYTNRLRFLLRLSVLPRFKRTSSDVEAIPAANTCPGRALILRTSSRIFVFNFSASAALRSGSCECETVTCKSSFYKSSDSFYHSGASTYIQWTLRQPDRKRDSERRETQIDRQRDRQSDRHTQRHTE